MTKEQLREIQITQLSIMDEIHRVCVTNNLRYYLIGGSALGAVRHNGFIPWDIDIDIAMPRPDYESFLNYYASELGSRFLCIDHHKDKRCNSPHALVVLKDSVLETITSRMNPHLKSYGIYVDILPLDKCPNTQRQRQRQAQMIKFLNSIQSIKNGKKYISDSKLKRICKDILRFFFGILPYSFVFDVRERVIKQYDDDFETEDAMWCSMLSHYKYDKLSMDCHIFGKPQLLLFENRQYFGPEKIKDYLKQLFGNYMVLPPVEEQETLYGFIVFAKW